MKKFWFIFIILPFAFVSEAQPPGFVLKPPQIIINFGNGNVRDLNGASLYWYRRVAGYCPPDGHYAFASYTSGCFRDDWHTLTEDHTPGDVNGNMLLVNAGQAGSVFFKTPISGLKNNTIYEIGIWLMNLCRPTKKCPFPLLPNLNIRLETSDGKSVANIITGEVPRVQDPWWTQYHALFTTPASASTLMLVMADNNPSGCGNDFALDDITFRECVKQPPSVTTAPKKTSTLKQTTALKPPSKKITPSPQKKAQEVQLTKPKTDSVLKTISVVKPNQKISSSTPLVLKTRENALVRKIETEAGEIKIDVYDNGEIDGDSVSIYHNNELIKSHMGLTQKPISFTIGINPAQPHHEIIMVAENLGSIPPNTSIMIITTPANRYEIFISSTEQKNAKVVFDLKK